MTESGKPRPRHKPSPPFAYPDAYASKPRHGGPGPAADQRRWGRLGRAGVTSLELALVMVPFMYLLMAVTDLARYFFTIQAMTTLMNDTIRYDWLYYVDHNTFSSMDGGCYTTFSAAQAVSGVAASPLLSNTTDPTIQLCVDYNPVTNVATGQYGGAVYQSLVVVQYPFTTITPGLSGLNGTLTVQCLLLTYEARPAVPAGAYGSGREEPSAAAPLIARHRPVRIARRGAVESWVAWTSHAMGDAAWDASGTTRSLTWTGGETVRLSAASG